MTQAFNLSQFANKLNSSGQTDNTGLQNSSVTVTAGTGMSGGGAVALGSSVTLTNAGVTSVAAGTGISVSGSTGAVTISASGGGVTSLNGNTGALKGFDFISTGTVGAVSSFNITSIPSGYQMLKLYVQVRNSSGGGTALTMGMRCSTNGGSTFVSTNSYGWGTIYNNGSGTGSSDGVNNWSDSRMDKLCYANGGPGAQYASFVCNIIQSSSSIPFSVISNGGVTGNGADQSGANSSYGQYNTTSYVNGLQLLVTNGSALNGGTWSLYGVKNA